MKRAAAGVIGLIVVALAAFGRFSRDHAPLPPEATPFEQGMASLWGFTVVCVVIGYISIMLIYLGLSRDEEGEKPAQDA